jgi:hypothetical protein
VSLPDIWYLPEINGMAPKRVIEIGQRQSWTTCHIGHLAVGTVFELPGKRGRPFRPVVLAEKPRREVGPEDRTPNLSETSQGLLIGEAIRVDTGEPVAFKLLAKTSVLTRCDLRYEARRGGGRHG